MKSLVLGTAVLPVVLSLTSSALAEKMQVGFLWHMHQPIYFPGENIQQTQNASRYSFSLYDVHNQRFGPYTTWPRNAVQTAAVLPNAGAQVSFSGSLVENLNKLQQLGINGGMWNNWQAGYQQAKAMTTAQGNTRMDMIGFTYHHALAPLLDERDIRMQIRMHKQSMASTFGGAYSKGFFPAETAFSQRMVPWLQAEGIEWTLVDNIHIDRASKTYPHTNASGLFAPNKADQINPAPAAWVQLNNLWAPSKVGAPDGYKPAWVQHVNPNTGLVSKIVADHAARYEGNEDGRGGYGAFLYQTVMDQYRHLNTDNSRPMYVMLHHDGDNFGGGSDAYYHSNFQNMVNWANGNPNYNVTTVQDYLSRFPVPQNAVIHVESGSWAGADNGDAEFKKWLGDPNAAGWSPDRNSWAVLTAAKNRVYTAEDILGPAIASNVINNTGSNAERGWHYLTQAMASDHWYWDGTEIWDSNVTRGSNLAVAAVSSTLTAGNLSNETTPPSVFIPQRDAYNPGEYEFGSTRESSDFKVWTYAYDVSGLSSVTLKYRVDVDGDNSLASIQNETYAGGAEVGSWISLPMTVRSLTSPGNILAPTVRADEYSAMIAGITNKLLDYYVEATDTKGNLTRTDIQHVWVGAGTGAPQPNPGGFVMDGVLDAGATQIAANGGMQIHYARKGGKIYLATQDAGEGNDHFIYLARNPGAMVNANWAKSGQVAQWDAYLADENSNDWEGWFDTTGATEAGTGPNGGVLEGTLDLLGEFGFIPAQIYLAVGAFANPDGGAMVYQVPASLDGNANLNANEFALLQLGQGWNGAAGNNWGTAANWFDGAIPNATGAHARLLGYIETPTIISTATAVTVGQITFDSAISYTIGGAGSVTFDVSGGNAAINVNQGAHVINILTTLSNHTTASTALGTKLTLNGGLVIANGSMLTIAGAGTTEINGEVLSSPSSIVRVNGGALRTTADLRGAGLQVNGGVGMLDASQHLSSISVAPGGQVVLMDAAEPRVIRAESIVINGHLELTDNALVIDYSGASPIVAVRDAIASGFNSGSWNGIGITSAFAAVTPNRALGFAEASEVGLPASFLGEEVDATSLLVRFTISGDADLSGDVNLDDFTRLAAGFGTNAAWAAGDFNYDGVVSLNDFTILASSFGESLPAARTATSAAPVPEPSITVILPAMALVSSRRRSRS